MDISKDEAIKSSKTYLNLKKEKEFMETSLRKKLETLQQANNRLRQKNISKLGFDQLDLDKKMAKYKAGISETERKYKVSLEKISELETTLQNVLPIIDYEPPVIKIHHDTLKSESEAVAVGLLSDVHCAERVDPKSVNFLNKYNPTICSDRLEMFFKKFLKLTEIERNGIIIDTAVLHLLGDYVHGYIHEEYKKSNYMSPTEEVLFMFDRLVNGFNFLKKHGKFKNIKIICQEGNHARTTDKLEIAVSYKNSFEWLMYQMLLRYYQNDKVIQVVIPESMLYYYTIFDKTIRSLHGHEIKYGGGVGGITIPLNKSIAQWDKGKRADYTFLAHWHTLKVDEQFVMNGSVIGYNTFAISIKGDFRPPQQVFLLIDSKRGKTVTWPIYLDKKES